MGVGARQQSNERPIVLQQSQVQNDQQSLFLTSFVGCKHSLTFAAASHPSNTEARIHVEWHSTSIEVSSPSRQAIECI